MTKQGYKPTEADLYASYLAIFAMPFGTHFKQRALESLALQIKQWLVTHISLEAVKHIRATGATVGLRRGHMMERMERAKKMFERQKPLGHKTFIKFFFDNDHVTLVVQAEANIKGTTHWSPCFPVPADRFIQNGSYAVRATPDDIEWAKSLAA
ncbi:hypothetical protein N5J06_03865 [Ralstonia sp. CHL-2022]|uniref:Uncharacterized protein n=1 Tax=Ralstonia mojiangensis TaxID=2953895 RepID=A0ABT2L549_9RALS|nr:hypothetical protein [Ralstonia mojiangensis]MCT7310067.1 hypothetical protein [Ralstonia mojiangensis]